MEWTSLEAALLAAPQCPACQGRGTRDADPLVLCPCVYRAVFRSCYSRFRRCAKADPYGRLVTYDPNPRGVDRHLCWARRNEDYCADFHAAGRRTLPPRLYRVFSHYHLLGARAELVQTRLRISRGTLFAWITEVEVKLGCEFAHMQPYSLFPPREYMRAPVLGEGTERGDQCTL